MPASQLTAFLAIKTKIKGTGHRVGLGYVFAVKNMVKC